MSEEELPIEAEKAIRAAAAYILASRYKTIGAPLSRIKKILEKSGLPFEACIRELEKRFNKVGLVLKKIKVTRGSRVSEILLATINPEIDLEDIRPYDKEVMSVLALIFFHSKSGEVPLTILRQDLVSLIGNEEQADKILRKGLERLKRDSIIKIDSEKGCIALTALGQALMPPPELIDEIIIDMLAKGPEKKEG